MAERVLVAGVGNIFCSDDGFGSAVAGELLGRELPDGVAVVDYGIRSMHLLFDLDAGVELLVLVDTVADAGGGPGSVAFIEPDVSAFGTGPLDPHGMDPTAVLDSLGPLTQEGLTTILIGCEPETIEEGIGLSARVEAAVPVAAEEAIAFIGRWIGDHPRLRDPALRHQGIR